MTEIPNDSFRMPATDAKRSLEQASALMKIGNFHEAIPLYESALATLERTYGPEQPEIAECLQELGEAYEAGQRLPDALNIHIRLLRMGEKFLGRANPNVVAMLLKLSQITELLGRSNDSLSYCQQALESAKQCMAQDDPLSQHIIERYNYLTHVVEAQAREQEQAAPAPGNWQEEIPLNDQPMESPGSMSMQDFAREMLSDMPGSPRGFSQPINRSGDGTSSVAGQSSPSNASLNAVAPPQFSGASNDYKASLAAGFDAANTINSQTNVNALPYSPRDDNGMPYEQVANQVSPDVISNRAEAIRRLAGGAGNPSGSTGSQFNAPGAQPHALSGQYNPVGDQPSGSNSGGQGLPPTNGAAGQGYDMSDLNAVRMGRRMDGSETQVPKASRGKRPDAADDPSTKIRRLAQTYAPPVVALIAIILTVIYLLSGSGKHEQAPESVAPQPHVINAEVTGRYLTSEGDKEIRLSGDNQAIMMDKHSAYLIPCNQITNGLGDLIAVMCRSLTEKQIWAEKTDYGIKTQDEHVYYVNDGAEAKVMAKMRHLAGWAQAYQQKKGEYPKFVGNAAAEFAFVNPINGRGIPVPIKILASQTVDGADVRGGLESGLEVGLVQNAGSEASVTSDTPCGIVCYAVVIGKNDENANNLRATRFFVRGFDRNGHLIASGQPGRTYVVQANDTFLAALPAGVVADIGGKAVPTRAAPKAKVKSKSKPAKAGANSGTSSGDDSDDDKGAPKAKAAPGVQTEDPPKSTELLLIENPAFPMVLMHHSLVLLLLGLAALVFLQSRLLHVEATGTSISSTSNTKEKVAKIAAAVLGGLAFLAIFIQLVIFG